MDRHTHTHTHTHTNLTTLTLTAHVCQGLISFVYCSNLGFYTKMCMCREWPFLLSLVKSSFLFPQVYWPQLSGCSIVPSKRAVDNICLAIPRGEFFGFVGVNGELTSTIYHNFSGLTLFFLSGAGKTSTFGMLTGDITPSSGTAFVSGYDIRTNMRNVSPSTE